jgi:hypothetical protein
MSEQYEKLLTAQDPETSPETLRSLSKDPDFFVRLLVFDNPNTPSEISESLRDELIEEMSGYLKSLAFTSICMGFFLICLGITAFRLFYHDIQGLH